MTTEITTILTGIKAIENVQELEAVNRAVRARRAYLESVRNAALQIELERGTPIRVCGRISPKYLSGLTGTIAGEVSGDMVPIRWDDDSRPLARRYSYSSTIKMPLSCIEVITRIS